ncbi:hypothetical protein [Streptomyces sp. Ac-502]|uniref:hypothetical protein n=1 Tax=Streptomyces sp. Ac-502 TaxID=3342801 RepID=UPI00386223BE
MARQERDFQAAGLLPQDGDELLLRDLPQAQFDEIVARDIREGTTREEALSLRHRKNLRRWELALTEILVSLEGQLSQRKEDDSAEARQWRKKARVFQEKVLKRRREARDRIARPRPSPRRPLRDAAREEAIQQLIAAHAEEYRQLFYEALQRLEQDQQ